MLKTLHVLTCVLLVFFLGLFSASGQKDHQSRIAIQAEKIFTVSHGMISRGMIVIEKGTIVYVGPQGVLPQDSTVLEAKAVIPGLIDTHTHLGTKSGWNEYYNKEFSRDVNPSLNILDVIDMGSVDFAFALSGGTTSAMVTPGSGNIICGELVVLKTAGAFPKKRILRSPAGLKMAFDIPQALAIASREFEKARDYSAKKKRGDAVAQDLRMEPLVKVLNKDMPAHIHCIPSYALENALELQRRFDIDIVIEHGLEADKVLGVIKKSGVPVSFGPLFLKQAETLPDPIPALLEKWGIKFSIHSDAPIVPSNNLLFYAAQAVKYGLSEEAALKAITLSAAEILRIDKRTGSLEPGKDGDLVLLDGPPLDIMTHVKIVIIDGKIVFNEKDWL